MKLHAILLVEARIDDELENMTRLKSSLEQRGLLRGRGARRKLADEFVLRAVGSVLHDYYSAAENIFKEIARAIDDRLPTGTEWHKDLLRQMKLTINGIRPAVLRKSTFEKLDEYRRFRHLVRNIYGFNLLPDRVADLLEALPDLDRALREDLQTFLATAKKTAAEELTP
ncbi:MAG: ribonuclease toxin HepT-like protein [Desulfotomaculales bacterium]